MKRNVMIARFPYGASEHPDVGDWLARTIPKIKSDPRVADCFNTRVDDTPITMTRNAVVERAKQAGADVLVMIDSDMSPDNPGMGRREGAKPFWDSSWDWLCAHEGPCVIAAPYVGPPPHCNVYVFRWANLMNDAPHPDMSLDQYGRDEAQRLTGILPAAALPTGLIMIDMRAFQAIRHPYFYYEWTDETESQKASTEDVTFTRDLALSGVPIYCNWDAWAGHWKRFCGTKPVTLTVDKVRHQFVDALRAQLIREQREQREPLQGDAGPQGVPA